MNGPKWLPRELQASFHLFDDVVNASIEIKYLATRFSTEINLKISDIYVVKELSKLAVERFRKSDELRTKISKAYGRTGGDKRIDRNPYNQLISQKVSAALMNLQQKQAQLVFIIRQQINACLTAALSSDGFIDDALMLASAHNKCVNLLKNFKFDGSAQICSVSFTSIFLPPTRIDIKYILQAIIVRRSEHCCLHLISSLLASCQLEQSGNDSESETSSIEILKALTSHMSSGASPLNDNGQQSAAQDPSMAFFDRMVSDAQSLRGETLKGGDDVNNDYLEKMVMNEENYFAFIFLKCLQLCPTIFEKQPTKSEIIKGVNKATRSLWTQTGATLEHVLLWWCSTPLACQPVAAARHLRDWLLNIQYDEAPETLVSILRCLGETITVHVACTTWDKQFRLALVASSLPIDYKFENPEFYSTKTQMDGTTTNGRVWSELLHTLTTFCNNCDQHSTIPNELPLVEQIAVLHRLDHSIHTMRIWAAAKAKSLCVDWCMDMFFKVVQNDVNQCLEQIKPLRTPDLVAPDAFETEIQVNVALRAKLISEVKVNICKLKLTYSECIEVLASICKMLCLATLSLCFPRSNVWQVKQVQEKSNEYVTNFLNEIYLPVLQATKCLEILNLVLRIMCEAWLDHIYMRKIKFSREGALNLLRDFEGVSEWIVACDHVLPEHVQILAKHEVLRTCEGVGKILLRKPFEIISMVDPMSFTPGAQHQQNHNEPQNETMLPPEMFVPNQQRWLELRAKNRRRMNAILCICAGHPCIQALT